MTDLGLDLDKHFRTVRNYLEGKEVHPNSLWLSVGYFIHGAGSWRTKPWESEDQLKRLKRATGRE